MNRTHYKSYVSRYCCLSLSYRIERRLVLDSVEVRILRINCERSRAAVRQSCVEAYGPYFSVRTITLQRSHKRRMLATSNHEQNKTVKRTVTVIKWCDFKWNCPWSRMESFACLHDGSERADSRDCYKLRVDYQNLLETHNNIFESIKTYYMDSIISIAERSIS